MKEKTMYDCVIEAAESLSEGEDKNDAIEKMNKILNEIGFKLERTESEDPDLTHEDVSHKDSAKQIAVIDVGGDPDTPEEEPSGADSANTEVQLPNGEHLQTIPCSVRRVFFSSDDPIILANVRNAIYGTDFLNRGAIVLKDKGEDIVMLLNEAEINDFCECVTEIEKATEFHRKRRDYVLKVLDELAIKNDGELWGYNKEFWFSPEGSYGFYVKAQYYKDGRLNENALKNEFSAWKVAMEVNGWSNRPEVIKFWKRITDLLWIKIASVDSDESNN